MKIISANYRNRDSEKKWLVRDESQTPEEAVEASTVQAKGVRFCRSGAAEQGSVAKW